MVNPAEGSLHDWVVTQRMSNNHALCIDEQQACLMPRAARSSTWQCCLSEVNNCLVTHVSMLERNSMYVVYCLSLCMLSAHCLRLIEGLHEKVGSPSWSKWQIASAIASRLFFSESSLLQSLLTILKDLVKQSVPRSLLANVSPFASCCSSVSVPAVWCGETVSKAGFANRLTDTCWTHLVLWMTPWGARLQKQAPAWLLTRDQLLQMGLRQ